MVKRKHASVLTIAFLGVCVGQVRAEIVEDTVRITLVGKVASAWWSYDRSPWAWENIAPLQRGDPFTGSLTFRIASVDSRPIPARGWAGPVESAVGWEWTSIPPESPFINYSFSIEGRNRRSFSAMDLPLYPPRLYVADDFPSMQGEGLSFMGFISLPEEGLLSLDTGLYGGNDFWPGPSDSGRFPSLPDLQRLAELAPQYPVFSYNGSALLWEHTPGYGVSNVFLSTERVTVELLTIPEPSTVLLGLELIGLGLSAYGFRRRVRRPGQSQRARR